LIAVQWLGWSSEWSAPAEHANDWLSDATALARELRPRSVRASSSRRRRDPCGHALRR
jgi:hypothetical protein